MAVALRLRVCDPPRAQPCQAGNGRRHRRGAGAGRAALANARGNGLARLRSIAANLRSPHDARSRGRTYGLPVSTAKSRCRAARSFGQLPDIENHMGAVEGVRRRLPRQFHALRSVHGCYRLFAPSIFWNQAENERYQQTYDCRFRRSTSR